MPDDPFSLSDLARLAGVTPRTIRYYVAQGLLPSPEAAGPATKYGEGHLARLRLIKRLQREHLPLAEIRGRIERMGDDDVRELLDANTEPPVQPAPAATLAFVRGLMVQSGVQPRVAESRASYPRSGAIFEPMIPDGFPTPALPPPSVSTPAVATPIPSVAAPVSPGPLPRSAVGDRSTWDRHLLAPDVELHVRRPLDRQLNKRVDQLIRIARELLAEEP
ncbi:MAG TPA: MerR family transcriptional regulator [Candidatus Limnocylindrales bacterium]|jgi:DNA-binding transcriptional MerR regulator